MRFFSPPPSVLNTNGFICLCLPCVSLDFSKSSWFWSRILAFSNSNLFLARSSWTASSRSSNCLNKRQKLSSSFNTFVWPLLHTGRSPLQVSHYPLRQFVSHCTMLHQTVIISRDCHEPDVLDSNGPAEVFEHFIFHIVLLPLEFLDLHHSFSHAVSDRAGFRL